MSARHPRNARHPRASCPAHPRPACPAAPWRAGSATAAVNNARASKKGQTRRVCPPPQQGIAFVTANNKQGQTRRVCPPPQQGIAFVTANNKQGQTRRVCPPPQQGIALITAMVIMLAVLIIGVSAARAALDSEKAARQERDRYVALQAAEAALADAERDIEGGKDIASPRAALFAPDSALGFADGCGDAPDSANLGLCAQSGEVDAPAWQHAPLDATGIAAKGTIAYGTFTAARLPLGGASMPARLPRYVIELMPYTRAGEDAARSSGGNFYRITAIGFGARDGTSVVLQSFYRKLAAQGNPP